MSALSLVLPITKVDATQRLVYGLMTSGAVDKAAEALDYRASKPYFEAWSHEIAKASDGRSWGNVRAMHGNVAVGILTQPIQFDDAAERMECCARIVDDQEWRKVEAGVYTGFSIGGAYVKRYQESGLTRYVARPTEVSLVDNPCNPDAVFQLVKQDGSTEARAFLPPLAKEGRRNSARDLAHLQAIHDHCVALGAACDGAAGDPSEEGGEPEDDPELAKRLDEALAERDRMERELRRMGDLVDRLGKRLASLERQPQPPKGVLVAVEKDGAGKAEPPARDLRGLLARVPDPRERANLLLSQAGYVPPEERK